MKTKKCYVRHTVCLIGAFTLGEAVISAPFFDADKSNILALLCAAAIAAVAAALFTPIINYGFSEKYLRDTPLRRVFGTLIFSLTIIFTVFLAAKSFVSYTDFVSGVMLRRAPFWLISVVFSIVVAVFVLSSGSSIYKFSLISAPLSAAIILFFFILSLPRFNVRNIVPSKFVFDSSLISQISNYLWVVFLPVTAVLIYNSLTLEAPKGNISAEGVLAGAIMLILCVANSIMIFGASQAAEMSYPYANAISTVSVGKLFTRMDGFSYFLFFISAISKVTVCLKVAVILIGKLGFKYKKTFIFICCALMFVLSIM